MRNNYKKTIRIRILLSALSFACCSFNSFSQGTCASPDGSFFNPNGIYPVTYTMAQDSNWCHNIPVPSSTPTTVCYQFRYPASGNIQMSFLVTTSGCSSGNCGQNYYINQSNPSNCGASTFCSGTAVSNFRIYNPDCSLFGTNTKIGCGMIRDSIYTLCIDVNPTGCSSINICPIVNCPSANCIPAPPCPLPNPNIVGVSSACSGNNVTLTASGGITYIWSTGDTMASVTVSPANTTTYTVTATNACGSKTFEKVVTVIPTPTADFMFSPTGVIKPNGIVAFRDISINGGGALWNFDDPSSGVNDSSTFMFPTHVYTAPGYYCTSLVSLNATCVDTVTKCITVTGDGIISIPNVFTPNGDGINDLFFIYTEGFKKLRCTIYDRWGLKMAEWDTIFGGWDGRTTSGMVASDGVYYYTMQATAVNDKVTEQQGFLQLLKQ